MSAVFLFAILTGLHQPPLILLMQISKLIENLWQSLSLAIALGLSREFVGRLRHRDFTGELPFDVLGHWVEEKGDKATCKVLHAALRDIGRADLAQDFEEQLLSKQDV